MKNNNHNKLQVILKMILAIILFGIFGWVYFMGIVWPIFISPSIPYSGAITSILSFVLTLILLFIKSLYLFILLKMVMAGSLDY